VFVSERETETETEQIYYADKRKRESVTASFICSVYHNWMLLSKFRNILVYCRYRAVFRCLLSLYPDMALLQYSCLHFLLTSREMIQRNS